jgi:NDP-sugar pyrophosphorylase family protein
MIGIVLAGGRGKRLGALTKKRQKVTLKFQGIPTVVRAVNTLLKYDIERVLVLTGYRSNDVYQCIQDWSQEITQTEKVQILDFPHVQGTLSRLTAALAEIPLDEGVCVHGADIVLPVACVAPFLSLIRERNQDSAVLLVSPHLSVAPTHPRALLHGSTIIDYTSHPRNPEHSNMGWLTDVGLRYFPETVLRKMQEYDQGGMHYIAPFLADTITQGSRILGAVFHEPWWHLGTVRDFQRVLTL